MGVENYAWSVRGAAALFAALAPAPAAACDDDDQDCEGPDGHEGIVCVGAWNMDLSNYSWLL